MPRTIALTIAYDGAAYAGWQLQVNANTVQAELERALATMTKTPTRVQGASRTDAGVHALGQVAVFRTAATIPIDAFVPGLKSLLPADISVLSAREVPAEFDPRHAATAKQYRYLIHCSAPPYALLSNKVWHRWKGLDTTAMHQAASHLVGEHDFSAFCASDDENHSKVRSITRCAVSVQSATELWPLYVSCAGDLVVIECHGNGFLKYMVRTIVGTLVEVGEGKRNPDGIPALLAACDRTRAGPCVPPDGLYLFCIEYKNS